MNMLWPKMTDEPFLVTKVCLDKEGLSVPGKWSVESGKRGGKNVAERS